MITNNSNNNSTLSNQFSRRYDASTNNYNTNTTATTANASTIGTGSNISMGSNTNCSNYASSSNRNTSTNSNADVNNSNNHNNTSNNRFSISSIRLFCESSEIGQLTDEAALFMSNQVTQKLRALIKFAEKFCYHSKRRKLLTTDVDYALRVMNMRPILGFYCNEMIPFRFATGGGHKIYYYDDKEIELADVIARVNIPKLPREVAIESHWLAIDGVQPTIPQNPPPLTRDEQRLECIDPLEMLNNRAYAKFRGDHHLYSSSNVMSMEFGPDGRRQMIDPYGAYENLATSKNKMTNLVGSANTNVLKKHRETVHRKELETHELSVEQQLYYTEITEACIGSMEPKRHHALSSLAHDPGLHQMLPRLCKFISEGVKVNVVHNNLALIIYLMRMLKSLLENPTLYLERYLHELCPTVITCIVSKQICNRPDQENHYAIRDFAAKLLANICRTYNTSTNCLQTRITRLLCKALDNPTLHLSSVYGCITALCELGPEVRQTLVFRRLNMIHERLKQTSIGQIERNSPEGRIVTLLAKHNLHLPSPGEQTSTTANQGGYTPSSIAATSHFMMQQNMSRHNE